MLERFQPVPPDPILGLGQLYAADTRETKIDLGVGVFKDTTGNTPIMSAVRKAELVLHDQQTTKAYKGLAGDEAFRDEMRSWCLGIRCRLTVWPRSRHRGAPVPFASFMKR